MSFYDLIDINKTIRIAKKVLIEYSRFLKILNNALYDLDIKERRISSFSSSFANPDISIIDAINKKDRNYAELKMYIDGIQRTINTLGLNQIEMINLKYVECLTIPEIAERLRSAQGVTTERQIKRVLKSCHIDFGIAYGVYVMKSDDTKRKDGHNGQ